MYEVDNVEMFIVPNVCNVLPELSNTPAVPVPVPLIILIGISILPIVSPTNSEPLLIF